jgi:hypothetical protein
MKVVNMARISVGVFYLYIQKEQIRIKHTSLYYQVNFPFQPGLMFEGKAESISSLV